MSAASRGTGGGARPRWPAVNTPDRRYEAFPAIDIPEDEARKAATTLAKRDDDVQSLRADMGLRKWMAGFDLTSIPLGFGTVLSSRWRSVA